ncbi:hypothetical protein NC653_035063 [Populus alba x Populus x berolinensis]|uniref:Uncharacterized protein n=1 Tax=Populus alba x Populus x berolinensis TaxID=444605 RepID=A0AAD6LP16_9ROSI|nr:hypothetical protein NC653_035063 [Populus alba x Populus x berolinensis]
MSEISSPRLNAWLKSRRDWKVETNGNHDKNAIGTKINTPIPASYILANSRTESHKPKLQTIRFPRDSNLFQQNQNGICSQ